MNDPRPTPRHVARAALLLGAALGAVVLATHASAWTPPLALGADGTGEGEEGPADEAGTKPRRDDLESTLALERSSGRREAHLALERGLAWLALQQATQPDGSFPVNDAQAPARVGVSALATLALMAGGSSPDRGPHGREVTRGIEFLLSKVDLESPAPLYGYVSDSGDKVSKNHGHGYATLALAQAYSVSRQTRLGERLHTALVAAVRNIESSQGSEGGWLYLPSDRGHEGSTTICLVQGLRAARNCGIRVDPTVIARAVDYVKRSQADDGSFRYRLGSDNTSLALTAAAISTLNATGTYSGPEVGKGYEFIWRDLRRGDWSPHGQWPFYERLYLAQALYQHSDPQVFETWIIGERQRLLREQETDGSWTQVKHGDVYATAVNCLVLALPEGMLPIFQR